MIDFNIKICKLPSDDFYLQWEHIYWWQFEFNLKLMLTEENKEIRR